MSSKIFLVLTLLLLFFFAAHGAQAAKEEESFGCIIIIDGLRGDKALEHALDGTMPTVKELFVDKGIWVNKAVAVAPSITGAALTSIVTGAYPGRHNLPSLTWFDRYEQKYYDLYALRDAFKFNKLLDKNRTRTIFEFFSGAHDTWSFGLPVYRGADNAVSIAWTFGYQPFVYRIRFSVALRSLRKLLLGTPSPRLTVAYSGWFDHNEHELGVDPPEMVEHYEGVDWMVSKTMELYRDCGILDKTYFILVSDHGQEEFDKRVDTWAHFGAQVPTFRPKWLEIPFVDHPWTVKEPDSYKDFVAVIPATDAKAFVYVAGPGTKPSWNLKPTLEQLRNYPHEGRHVDFVAEAVNWQPVALCAAADKLAGTVHVYAAQGAEGIISRVQTEAGVRYRYSVAAGVQDPLGYTETEGVKDMVCRKLEDCGSSHLFTDTKWLEASADTNYPDAVVQLSQLFDCPRAPDLFLSPRKGYALVPDGQDISSHGAISAQQMHATLAVMGPGLTAQRIHTARTVDAAPTMLHCLRVPHDDQIIDGRVLVPVSEALPGPSTTNSPEPAPVLTNEDELILDELGAINDELLHRLIAGESFSNEQVYEIIGLLQQLEDSQRPRLGLFVRKLALSLNDQALAEELLQALSG